MVEGGLPGQTGAIFHFRPYPPISGGGKGLTYILTAKRRQVDMRGPIWSDLGHLGLPDLVASTIMDASNSHVDGRADKPSDSRFGQFSLFEFEPLHSDGQ